jgi:hypothetical protein
MEKTAEEIAAEKATADAAAKTKADADAAAAAKAAADAAKTPEQKAAEQQALDDAAKASKAPDKYELALPEGGFVDDADIAKISEIAKAKGWTNDQAQASLTEYAEALEAQSAAFLSEVKAHPEYGGEKLPETQRLARLALETLRPAGTPRGDALRKLLDKSGYGNHVEVISLLADLGKRLSEDTPLKGGAPPKVEKSPQDVLYPTTVAKG